MFEETEKYPNQGHFFFKKGNSLKDVSKDVPNLPGVYYIVRLARGRVDLVYIGQSGTINQSGYITQLVPVTSLQIVPPASIDIVPVLEHLLKGNSIDELKILNLIG